MTRKYYRPIICCRINSELSSESMLLRVLFVLIAIVLAGLANANASFEKTLAKPKPRISIVIDDLGDNSVIASDIVLLPGQLTLAILPHTPHATNIANMATKNGHEVIMHLPMEAFTRPDLLGPGALFSDMQKQQFIETFLHSAGSVPNLVGFNNHMGSLLTQNSEKMHWLMQMAQQKDWYFLDSKTSTASIAQRTAKGVGLATIGRDIFLDHHTNLEELSEILSRQLEKAKKIALLRGHVVVICHPYAETYEFLSKELPNLMTDFELVKLSELLPKENTRVAKSELK